MTESVELFPYMRLQVRIVGYDKRRLGKIVRAIKILWPLDELRNSDDCLIVAGSGFLLRGPNEERTIVVEIAKSVIKSNHGACLVEILATTNSPTKTQRLYVKRLPSSFSKKVGAPKSDAPKRAVSPMASTEDGKGE